MANTIEYADSPNVDTAFVVQEGGQKNRAVLTAPQDTTTLELPDNPNSTKGYVTIDGKKHKVILIADISGNGGGGGGAVDSVNGKTGVVVLDATDVGAVPQYETMPTADASNVDLIVQFVGATDTYTNGYFYKCTGAGEPVVYSWSQVDVQPAPAASTAVTATLVVADWSSNTQTVNVTGVTSSNNVIVAPAPASQADYTTAGILCTAQGSGTLTFTCTTVPSSAITVNVLII